MPLVSGTRLGPCAAQAGARVARFGVFELDLRTGELRKRGLRVRLQDQPFQVLALLVQRAGDLVTREELRACLWPDTVFVDFDQGLNKAILKIRFALGDSADSPRFVETLERRGYRFMADVQLVPESRSAARHLTRSSRKARRAIALTAIASLAAAVATWLVARPRPPADLTVPQPFTATPGWEHSPSFSPDGSELAYSWCEEGAWELRGNCDILVRSVGSDTSRRLTDYPGIDTSPAWSPDGRFIAFLRIRPEGMATYLLVPAGSGPERRLAETLPPAPATLFGAALSWFPDGKHLAAVVRDDPSGSHGLAVLSAETGARTALTAPASTGMGVTAVAVAPDGRRMVFARTGLARSPRSDLYIAGLNREYRLEGSPRQLLGNLPAPVSLAWEPSGDAVIFSSGAGLWRMQVDGARPGAPERLSFGGRGAFGPAVSPDGRRLAYSQRHVRENIWRVEFDARGKVAGRARALAPSTREDAWPQASPDGRRVAFVSDRSGSRQVYVCDLEGSNLRRLTSLPGGVERPYPGWSPDGRRIVFSARVEGNSDLFEIDVLGGPPHRLTFEPSTEFQPQWSRDGKWVYFTSDRTGTPQIWKVPDPGPAVQVTEHGGEGPFESPDGRYLYYFKPGTAGAEQVWRRRLPDGEGQQVLGEVFRGNFAMVGEAAYFVPQRDVGCDCYHLQRLDLVKGRTEPVMDLKDVGGGLSISSDGRSLLYTTVVHTSSDLFLVGRFR